MLQGIRRNSSGRSARPDGRAIILRLVLPTILGVALALGLAMAGCGSQEVTTSQVTGTTATVETTVSTTGPTSSTTTPGSGTTGLPTTISSPSTTASSGTTTTEALSSAEIRLPNGHIKAMGFIDDVWESGGVRRISIDYAEMLTGEEARVAAVEAGDLPPGEELPNDYYIRNVNPQKREFTVSATAPITTATFGGGMDEPVTWDQFKSFWSASPPEGGAHLHEMPWWIERVDGEVVSIAEQYLP